MSPLVDFDGAAVWVFGEAQHLGDHAAERPGGPNLMIGHLAQQRFDRPQIIQDAPQP